MIRDRHSKGDTYVSELLAILFFFQLLPVPVDLNVFLMGLDDFVLDFVRTLLLVLLFEGATLTIYLFCVNADLRNSLLSFLLNLLKGTFLKITGG